MIKKSNSFFYIIFLCFLFVPVISFSAINEQINYQGKLTDDTGSTVSDGDYDMVFNLYTVSSGGSSIWTESRTGANQVTVTKGLFSVMLGEVTSISDVDFNQTLYLGVTIGADSEMTPRKKIGSVPSAIESKKLQGLFASQFLRSDATNSTSSASTFLNVSQVGAGNIASFTGVGGINALTIKSNGNVGIGTTSPNWKLSVSGIGSFDDYVRASYFNATSTTATSTFAGGLSVAGSSGLTVLNNGVVGIGTIDDNYRFSVQGDINVVSGGVFAETLISAGYFVSNSTVSSSTFANGINLSNGCFAMGGTCLSTGGISGAGGLDTEIQFNQSGSLAGNSSFTWDFSNKRMTVPLVYVDANTGGTPSYGLNVYGIDGYAAIYAKSGGSSGAMLELVDNSDVSKFIVDSTGKVGIGTSTPNWKLSVSGIGSFDDYVRASYFVSTSTATSTFAGGIQANALNITSSTASSTFANGINLGAGCFAVNGTCLGSGGSSQWTTVGSDIYYTTGNVGIGTTTPYTKFAVTGDSSFTATSTFYGDLVFNKSTQNRPNLIQVSESSSGVNGGVIFATSTNYTSAGQEPLLVVRATTTGALDYSRVGIGTNGMGNIGLRDQFTVAGRIYSTWRELRCDSFGLGIVANVSADTSSVCGDFAFDADTDARIIATGNTNPAYGRLSSGVTTADAGEGVAFRTYTTFINMSENPVFESKLKLGSGTISDSIFIEGFYGSTFGSDISTLPTDGAYFIATTTGNWIAVTKQSSTESYTDTGVVANTTLRKMRIEGSLNKVVYIIDDQIVATHTSNIPTANLAPAILNAITVTGGSSRITDIQYLRVWVDDPPGGYSDEVVDSFPENTFSSVEGADVAENYLTDDPVNFKAGLIVTSSNNIGAKVSLSTEPYDRNLMGVIATSPHLTLGTETKDTVRVGLVGRVPVVVSLENGPIKAGDRITSSSVSGIGMKATRPGYIVGLALEDFDPEGNLSKCNTEVIGDPIDLDGKENTKTCQGTVLIKIQNNFDMGIGDVIGDVGGEILGVSDALLELTSDVFTKGAELTRLAVGKIITITGIFKNVLTSIFTVLPDGNINLPRGHNQITGKGMVMANNTESVIYNSNILVGSQIFITPTTSIDFPIAVIEKNAGNGFRVRIPKSVDFNITFDWLVINTYLVGDEEELPINLDTNNDPDEIVSEGGVTVVDDDSNSATTTESEDSDEGLINIGLEENQDSTVIKNESEAEEEIVPSDLDLSKSSNEASEGYSETSDNRVQEESVLEASEPQEPVMEEQSPLSPSKPSPSSESETPAP